MHVTVMAAETIAAAVLRGIVRNDGNPWVIAGAEPGEALREVYDPWHRILKRRPYPSDLTDAEWALIAPMIPPTRRGGRPRDADVREVLNGSFHVLWTGCQCSALPKDLPPNSTVDHDFMLWEWDGTLGRIHHSLYVMVRDREGREASEASPSAAVIDSQSAKGAQKRGAPFDPQGSDAGKKVTGRKRHILVDTLGLLLSVIVHPADVQDRDGARELLRTARRWFPFIETIFADGGDQGPRMAATVAATGASSATSSVTQEPSSPLSVSP